MIGLIKSNHRGNAMAQIQPLSSLKAMDIVATAESLGRRFAAEAQPDEDQFVAENFKAVKQSGLVEAGVPRELGGAGATTDELAEMLRVLAHHCASTALAFSMH